MLVLSSKAGANMPRSTAIFRSPVAVVEIDEEIPFEAKRTRLKKTSHVARFGDPAFVVSSFAGSDTY
jgi:hypothetical protein